jgi:hypothetical protein
MRRRGSKAHNREPVAIVLAKPFEHSNTHRFSLTGTSFRLNSDTKDRMTLSGVAPATLPAACFAAGSSRQSRPPQKSSIGLSACVMKFFRFRRTPIPLGKQI